MTNSEVDRVELELTGERAQRGITLAAFEAFLENFRQALIDFDRQRTGEETRRGGALRGREQLVTALNLVNLEVGSAIAILEPAPPPEISDEQVALEEPEMLAIENLRSLIAAIEDESSPFDEAVATRLAGARTALGSDGTFTVTVRSPRRAPASVLVNRERIGQLEGRRRSRSPGEVLISGRLHAVATEPDRVEIRTPSGVNWMSRYPAELEEEIAGLLTKSVWARGMGIQTGQRGSLELTEIHPLAEFEQSPLFTAERVPLDELMSQQAVRAHGGTITLPESLTEAELDAFIATLDEI